MIVVADAGQILDLCWIGCLSRGLPPALIHVVEQVWTEITEHAQQAPADPRLEREPVVEMDPALQAGQPSDAGAARSAVRTSDSTAAVEDQVVGSS